MSSGSHITAMKPKHLYICIYITGTTMVQLLKRQKVLIKTRSFVIVRLRGCEGERGGGIKLSLNICSGDELLIWRESERWCCVFVRLINAASASPHRETPPPSVLDEDRLLQEGCRNLKDTSVFNFCLLVLLQRIYYVFNHSPTAQTVPPSPCAQN